MAWDDRRIETFDQCRLEWDKVRGVVYVHSSAGACLLTVRGLPSCRVDVSLKQGLIEVCVWTSRTGRPKTSVVTMPGPDRPEV